MQRVLVSEYRRKLKEKWKGYSEREELVANKLLICQAPRNCLSVYWVIQMVKSLMSWDKRTLSLFLCFLGAYFLAHLLIVPLIFGTTVNICCYRSLQSDKNYLSPQMWKQGLYCRHLTLILLNLPVTTEFVIT